MKMTLNHEEINEAIVDWVAKQGIDLADKETIVELTAGRGTNGNSASIDIKPIKHKLDDFDAAFEDDDDDYGNSPEELEARRVDREHLNKLSKMSLSQAISNIVDEPQEIGDVSEAEPIIPDDTPVLHTDF